MKIWKLERCVGIRECLVFGVLYLGLLTTVCAEESGVPRGPHGGRLIESDGFAVEVSIYERGVPPQFRLFITQKGKSVPLESVRATITLSRLAAEAEVFDFKPAGDFLVSDRVVGEPHSFDVSVHVESGGAVYDWRYKNYEGRVSLSAAQAASSGIESETAGPRELKTTSRIRGKVTPSEHRIAHIIPRFAGLVKEGRKHIGDRVQRGEVMAVIESNQSLQPYEIRSQIEGVVISGHLIVGEYVAENQPVYVVADLSEVWADFLVPFDENTGIRGGQELVVADAGGRALATGTISYVAPYADERSQAQLVRAVLPNPEGKLLPGMYVVADVTTAKRIAPVAIRNSAIQTMREVPSVFVQSGDIYEGRPVELGLNDGEWSEVLEGLAAGLSYVTKNSFVIKADILKSGAAHDH